MVRPDTRGMGCILFLVVKHKGRPPKTVEPGLLVNFLAVFPKLAKRLWWFCLISTILLSIINTCLKHR
jgi:hypothetical protein